MFVERMEIDQRINQRADQALFRQMAERQADFAQAYARTKREEYTVREGDRWVRRPVRDGPREAGGLRTVRQGDRWVRVSGG